MCRREGEVIPVAEAEAAGAEAAGAEEAFADVAPTALVFPARLDAPAARLDAPASREDSPADGGFAEAVARAVDFAPVPVPAAV